MVSGYRRGKPGQKREHCGGGRDACVSRELTKVHEEIRRGTLEELVSHFSGNEGVKGEIVIVVSGKTE